MATFYLSSTFEDLKDCRREARKALERAGHSVISMEAYGPSGRPPLDVCLADVARCDVYIGIVAWRYGFVPADNNPDAKSITECEYRHARKLEKECWIFLLAPDAPWPFTLIDRDQQAERVKAFRDELSTRHVVCFFNDCEELKQKLEEAVKKRFPGRGRSFWDWLVGLLPSWPWYATVPAALGAALLIASLALALHYWRLSPPQRAEFLIKYRLWDAPLTDALGADFALPPGVTPGPGQCVPPNTNLWSYSDGQWCLTGDNALLIKGRDWGVRRLPKGTTGYDFEMEFIVVFQQGDEAAWVVRAQEGGRGGYVFKLQRDRNTQRVSGAGPVLELYLHGWASTPDGQLVALGKTPNNLLDIGDIYENDYFYVTVAVKGNTFLHKIRIQNVQRQGADRPFFGSDFPVPDDFKDLDSRWPYAGFGLFPYGSVGFFAPAERGEILIPHFRLAPPPPAPPS